MKQHKNRNLVIVLTIIPLVMLSLSFAAVPLYNLFCRVTGFGGVPQVAEEASTEILDRIIEIRFDGSLEKGMPWTFKPAQHTMKLRIGETGLAFYDAYNPTDKTIAGTASYNVFPYSAGAYFTKIDCFCFTMQVLKPGERVKMPVTFYVDPDMVNDEDAKHINSITLSYTFHVTDLPEEQASLAIDTQTDIKTTQ
jgi:cytochrome c oxidase assembly protein subunit 11